ncbi:MAG: stealth family protein [Fibromonadales bacterium]|nr:stealth family protein [Fibromonadales bacterium]
MIDFVIPWVDGNDPEWQADKAKYSPSKNSEVDDSRYRDMGLLPYWFRGVEKFAPWVNKIHFITCGHLPGWLNVKHPKLNLVKHSDYIPQEYLPTFNSHTITFNIHRILNLAENFVFFNDDTFLLNNAKDCDFFVDYIPCDQALMRNMTPLDTHFARIMFNNMSVINKHFRKHEVIKKNFFKWFSPKYGLNSCFINWQNYRQVNFSDIVNPHLTLAYKKSQFEYVWNLEGELLHETCLHKFRDIEDVSDWLVRYFRIMRGEFKPSKVLGRAYSLGTSAKIICNAVKTQKYKVICINDGASKIDFDFFKKEVSNAFEAVFPEKCSFEV